MNKVCDFCLTAINIDQDKLYCELCWLEKEEEVTKLKDEIKRLKKELKEKNKDER